MGVFFLLVSPGHEVGLKSTERSRDTVTSTHSLPCLLFQVVTLSLATCAAETATVASCASLSALLRVKPGGAHVGSSDRKGRRQE